MLPAVVVWRISRGVVVFRFTSSTQAEEELLSKEDRGCSATCDFFELTTFHELPFPSRLVYRDLLIESSAGRQGHSFGKCLCFPSISPPLLAACFLGLLVSLVDVNDKSLTLELSRKLREEGISTNGSSLLVGRLLVSPMKNCI